MRLCGDLVRCRCALPGRPAWTGRASLLGLLLVCMAVTHAQEAGMFRVPEYDAKGRLVYQILGSSAKWLSNGDIDVTNLRLEVYRDGEVDATVTTSQCLVNRAKGTATSEQAVRIERDDMIVTGIGFRFDAKTQKITIFSKVRLELKQTVTVPDTEEKE